MVFFKAASMVLGHSGIYGSFSYDICGNFISRNTRELFTSISKHLYQFNIKTLQEKKLSGDGIIDSFNMVYSEQIEVEKMITPLTSNDKKNINQTINLASRLHPCFIATCKLTGEEKIDFFNIQHRIILGRMYIIFCICGSKNFNEASSGENSFIALQKSNSKMTVVRPVSFKSICHVGYLEV